MLLLLDALCLLVCAYVTVLSYVVCIFLIVAFYFEQFSTPSNDAVLAYKTKLSVVCCCLHTRNSTQRRSDLTVMGQRMEDLRNRRVLDHLR